MLARLFLLIVAVIPSILNGQQLQQATFTDNQAQTGASVYSQSCAACHLPDLTGSFEAPALNDINFRTNWSNRTVAELFYLLKMIFSA